MATGTVADWVTGLLDLGLGDDIGTDHMNELINQVVQDVNSRQPWSFLQASATVTLSAAQVTLPARFNKAISFVIDSQSKILVPEEAATIRKRFVGNLTTTGCPDYYYFVGNSMYVYKIPDKSYTATLDYYQDEVTVTTTTVLSSLLCPAKHHEVYQLGLISRLYLIEDDTELSNLFAQRMEKKLVDMMEDVTMHQYDEPKRMYDVWESEGW